MPRVTPTSGSALGAGTAWVKPCEHQAVPDALEQALAAPRGTQGWWQQVPGPRNGSWPGGSCASPATPPGCAAGCGAGSAPRSACGRPQPPARGAERSGMTPGSRGPRVDKTPLSRTQQVQGGLWGAGPTPGYSLAWRLFHPCQASSRAGSGAVAQPSRASSTPRDRDRAMAPGWGQREGARGWEQENPGLEERGRRRRRNLHQLREGLEGKSGTGGFSAEAMPEAFAVSQHGAGMAVISPTSLREYSPRSIYSLSFGQHGHTQSPAQPCASLGHPTPPLGDPGISELLQSLWGCFCMAQDRDQMPETPQAPRVSTDVAFPEPELPLYLYPTHFGNGDAGKFSIRASFRARSDFSELIL